MPDNRTVELILKLRDEATATWNQVHAQLDSSSKQFIAGMQGRWLGFTATVAAAAYSLKKVFDFAEEGVKFGALMEQFGRQVTSMGGNAEQVFNQIKRASGGMIDDKSILESANKAMALNVPMQKLGDLMLIARERSKTLVIPLAEEFDKLTNAVEKGTGKALLNAGVIVDAKHASTELAAALGTTSGAITTQAQRTEVLNMVIKDYIGKAQESASATLTLSERQQKIAAEIQNVKEKFNIASLYAEVGAVGVIQALATVFIGIGTVVAGIFKLLEDGWNALPFTKKSHAIQEFGDQMNRTFEDLAKQTGNTFGLMTSDLTKFGTTSKDGMGALAQGAEIAETNLQRLEKELKKLQEDLAGLKTGQGFEIQVKIDKAKHDIDVLKEHAARMIKDLGDFSPSDNQILDKMFANSKFDAQKVVDDAMKKINAAFGNAKSVSPVVQLYSDEEKRKDMDRVSAYADASGRLIELSYKSEQDKKLGDLQEWYDKAIAMAHDNEEVIAQIERVKDEETNRIKAEAAQKTWQEVADYAIRAFNLIDSAMQQSSQGEIDQLTATNSKIQTKMDQRKTGELKVIEDTKTAQLRAIDLRLKSENLSAEQRKALELQRFNLSNSFDDQRNAIEAKYTAEKTAREEKFNQQVKEEKVKAFNEHKAISILESIINTALAVTQALAHLPPPESFIVAGIEAAMGLAQTAIIASQSPPAFHEGGVVGGESGSDQLILAQAGEVIRTRDQENSLQRMLKSNQIVSPSESVSIVNNFHFNFSGVITTRQAFKHIVEDGMREMGISNVADYFKNSHAKTTLNS